MSVYSKRHEDGITAVVVAISALLLFSIGALAVDLGNAYTRKRDVQAQADFATLAAGEKLPSSGTTPLATDEEVLEVVKYLNENHPQDDKGITPVTPGQLVDTDPATGKPRLDNGHVYYGSFNAAGTMIPSPNKITVLTPQAQVDFGLAAAMGFSNTRVSASATVAIRSPGIGVLPVFAVDGCDFGAQSITDPAGGHDIPVPVPPLDADGDTNDAVLDSLDPTSVELNATTPLTIDGNKLSTVTQVGFFRTVDPTPPPPTTIAPATTAQGQITLTQIPPEVSAIEEVWYVRVFKDGQWSPMADALPFRVGDAILECASGSNDGNFGTLKLPRNDVPSGSWLAMNMASSLQEPLSLAIYPPTAPDTCTTSGSPAVRSVKPYLNPGTNCVDTDTGLAANPATDGLITGVADKPGRLDKDTTPGCGPGGSSDRFDTGIKKSGSINYTINNDILTCFFTDEGVTVADITQKNYAGQVVISADIFESPRFLWVPVLKVDPANGGSQFYSIVDFRPAFVTDQPPTASKTNNTACATAVAPCTTNNGLRIENSGVTTIKVIFFNDNALPGSVRGPTIEYLGTGPRAVRLID